MKNNRIEIVVASVLLISFFFFIVSYSNYDLRKKRKWNDETAQFVYTNGKVVDRHSWSSADLNSTLQHMRNHEKHHKSFLNKKEVEILRNSLTKSELQFHGIYSQLLFQRKTVDVSANLKPDNYT